MSNRTSYQAAVNNRDILMTITSDQLASYKKHGETSVTPGWLLPGEEIKLEEPCVGYKSGGAKSTSRPVDVTVWVTNYRLRFQQLHKTHGLVEDHVIDVPLGSISKIEKQGHSYVRRGDDAYGIQLKCKDMRKIVFYHSPEKHSRRQLYESLHRYAFPNTNKLPFFATVYKGIYRYDGWTAYNARAEFNRMYIPDQFWDVSRINETYDFASTYPSCVVLPRAAVERGDAFINAVGDFRSKRRIPVLTWYDCRTRVAICRCAQPLVGVTSKRSTEDEALLQDIVDANPSGERLSIYDARPLVNARVNKAVGGGYEEAYASVDLEFLGIENIHVVRDSLKRVKAACYPRIDARNFYKHLDESKWLAHLQTIVGGARRIVADAHERRRSVLVHCSDGWDRTAQLTSLAMLQLDAYYRTLVGFIVLVEKEWCSFGHKFAHRIGHGEDKHDDEERSPIFVQFIDCVWQIFSQSPSAFEFNVHLLKTILDEVYACRFGTFLYNSEKERTDLEVKTTTVSLWSYVLERRDEYTNELYEPSAAIDASDFLAAPSVTAATRLWSDYYCRYNAHVIVQPDDIVDEGAAAAATTTAVDDDKEGGRASDLDASSVRADNNDNIQ